MRELFERYATGQHTYESLIVVATKRGLRNVKGGQITLHGIETMLGNPFYAGLIRIKRTGETYEGVHEPLIPMALYRLVRDIRTGRRGQIKTRHDHLFRRLFTCGLCHKTMIPELQKGRVYYRCKRKGCPTTTVREDEIDAALRHSLRTLQMATQAEAKVSSEPLAETAAEALGERRAAIELQIAETTGRIGRLTDLLIDGTIDTESFAERKGQAQLRLQELRQDLAATPSPERLAQQSRELAELQKNLSMVYEMAKPDEKRQLIDIVWPNRRIIRKNVDLEPSDWLIDALATKRIPVGAPLRGHGRTLHELMRIMRRVCGGGARRVP